MATEKDNIGRWNPCEKERDLLEIDRQIQSKMEIRRMEAKRERDTDTKRDMEGLPWRSSR